IRGRAIDINAEKPPHSPCWSYLAVPLENHSFPRTAGKFSPQSNGLFPSGAAEHIPERDGFRRSASPSVERDRSVTRSVRFCDDRGPCNLRADGGRPSFPSLTKRLAPPAFHHLPDPPIGGPHRTGRRGPRRKQKNRATPRRRVHR